MKRGKGGGIKKTREEGGKIEKGKDLKSRNWKK